jgi:hypothetical protein
MDPNFAVQVLGGQQFMSAGSSAPPIPDAIQGLLKRLNQRDLENQLRTMLPDEIPPEVILGLKGITPSRKQGDAIDYDLRQNFDRNFSWGSNI